MAETAIFMTLQKLGSVLANEASLLLEVRNEVEWCHNQLAWMQSFLKDANTKRRRGDERAKLWVREVTNVSLRAQDIIEAYIMEKQAKGDSFFGCFGRCILQLKSQRKLGLEIKDLRTKILEISKNKATYGLVDLQVHIQPEASSYASDSALQMRRKISPHHGDITVVGFEEHKQEILRELLDPKSMRLRGMSILGMGGLGKTTLAKIIFNSNEIRSSFSTKAWVFVSQEYTLINLLKNITRQVTGGVESEGLDESALKEKVYQFFKGRRYFIVMDDIWRVDALRLLEDVFPDDNNGSRLLLTTRFEEVARFTDPRIDLYNLPLLNQKDSWQLFLTRAFRSDHDVEPKSCPSGLENVALSLVKKCGGLPLALLVLGGLMSTKKANPMEWMKVADRMDWASTQDGEHCLNILALSYDDLPDHLLKACFLYLSIFPEDSVIQASQLMELWIAEGFIPEMGNSMMEDTAESYLDQLAQRSMIQVISRNIDGSVFSLRIHDLFRDLCLREAREEGFLHVYNTCTELDRIRLDRKPNRLAIRNINKVQDGCLPANLRSLSIINGSGLTREMIISLKKLRVLHLEGDNLGFEKFSTQDMFYLRYLGLRFSKDIRELPPAIRDLRNLQILDVTGTNIGQLPEELGRITTLRHLYLACTCRLPPDVGKLTNLQTLDEAYAGGGWIEKSLGMLSNLRKVSIFGLESVQEKAFANALRKLQHLAYLKIEGEESMSTEFIRALSHNNHFFKLYLVGIVLQRKLPHSHEFPKNLAMLYLYKSRLEEDPMAILQQLPNLVSLGLKTESYTGIEMTCTSGGFLRLEWLVLSGLDRLRVWNVENGAMPTLAYLFINQCGSLTEIPAGLQHLTSLRGLVVIDSRPEFRSRLQEGNGTDWWKIKHVPKIRAYYLCELE